MRAVLDGKVTPDDPDDVTIHPHPGHEHLQDAPARPAIERREALTTNGASEGTVNHHA